MAQREQVFVGQPQIFGGARLLPSPSQFFLGGEDRLRIVSANSLTGVSLKIQWRAATPAGEIVPSSVDHTPNSDRTIKTDDYELGTGSLLNVTVYAGAGTPLIGQTFIMVQIVRGAGLAAIVLGTILAGYVTSTQALGFPGSPIQSSIESGGFVRLVQGATPGAGQEISTTVPAGARWKVQAIEALLTTDATVASRAPILAFDSPAVITAVSSQIGAATASSQIRYCWADGSVAIAPAGLAAQQSSMPSRAPLLAGQRLRTITVNLQAGDQYTAVMHTITEWLEVS